MSKYIGLVSTLRFVYKFGIVTLRRYIVFMMITLAGKTYRRLQYRYRDFLHRFLHRVHRFVNRFLHMEHQDLWKLNL